MTDPQAPIPTAPAAGPTGWDRGQAFYQHPGYGHVDHQLGPLMDAIRWVAEPPFGDHETALVAIEAVEVAMAQLRRNLREEARDRAAEHLRERSE